MTMAVLVGRTCRLATRERWLVALGLVAWVVLGLGGLWLYRQLARPPASCGTPLEARNAAPRPAPASPRNALQLLTGTGRCP